VTVFVDDFRVPARVGRLRARWSHLSADSREELHAFADSLGLKRMWFQDKGDGRWHYDVTDRVRTAAIRAGAVPLEVRVFGAWILARRTFERQVDNAAQTWLESNNSIDEFPACDLCHEGWGSRGSGPVAVRVNGSAEGLRLCAQCRDGWDYQASLTPAERRADDASQAAYVAETQGRPNG
jgi:hypothetical protein